MSLGRRPTPHGFSLIELIIVSAIIATLAAMAWPNLVASKERANEIAAVSVLRTLVTVQTQFALTNKVDRNENGEGEYGGFLELSGGAPGRMAQAARPGMLSPAFQTLNGVQEVVRSGFLFRLYLPAADGTGVHEAADGTFAGIDDTRAEQAWCAYAWPLRHHQTGSRAFCINQAGVCVATDHAAYSGSGASPEETTSGAAFESPGILGALARGRVGQDGRTWNEIPW